MPNRNKKGFHGRDVRQDGAGRMMLHPLAEIRVGMLMAVMIGGGQLVMDLQCRGKGSQGQEHQPHGQRHGDASGSGSAGRGYVRNHRGLF